MRLKIGGPFVQMLSRIFALLGLCSGVANAGAAEPAQTNFFTGKQISIVVGYTPGGAIDGYARLLARHLGRHIPGNPNVIVQNMPGAASLTAVRALGVNLPKDGTSIVAFNPGLLLAALTTPDKINLKFADYAWLGNMAEDVGVCFMSAGSGVKTWDQMRERKEVVMGDTGDGGASFAQQRLLKFVLGINIKQVGGYPGNGDKKLAIERGELDGDCSPWNALPVDWISGNKINLILRFSPTVPSGMAPGVPWARELVEDPNKKHLLDLINAPSLLGKPYLLSKEVPPDRLQVLRVAFADTLKDPALLADARKMNFDLASVPYAKAQDLIARMDNTPSEVVSSVREILGQ
jgi:tripartite-type tricarboxylate transporter receptor subunit TctC